jgi:hypothetical protein
MYKWKLTGFIATAVIVLVIPIYIASYLFSSYMVDNSEVVQYIGKERCRDCHQKEYNAWTGSHHDKAMDIATDSTVLGDFNNAEFEYNGIKSKFYKKDNKFFVYTN